MANEDKNAKHCLVSDIHISGGRPDDRFGASYTVHYRPRGICKDSTYCSRILLSNFGNKDREINIPINYEKVKILYPSDTKTTLSDADNGINVRIPTACTSVILETN